MQASSFVSEDTVVVTTNNKNNHSKSYFLGYRCFYIYIKEPPLIIFSDKYKIQ